MSDAGGRSAIAEEAQDGRVTRFYLDQQMIIYHAFAGPVREAVAALSATGATFPFSPAHVEEIAKAHAVGGGPPLAEQMDNVADISRGIAIMPAVAGPAVVRSEDPWACLSRVQDDGGRDRTEWAIVWERARMLSYVSEEDRADFEKTRDKVRQCRWQEVFSEPIILEHVGYMARCLGFRMRLETFQERERTLATLFDVLNGFGFRAELNAKRVKNRVHDVSHAIYASYADVFVTRDRDLREQSKAVFQLCGIKVEILDYDEFIARADV